MGCFHNTLTELEKLLSKKTILNTEYISNNIRSILYRYDINTPEKTINLIEFWFCRTDIDEDNRIEPYIWGNVSKEILTLAGLGTNRLLPNTKMSLETEIFSLSNRTFCPDKDDSKKISDFFSKESQQVSTTPEN